MRSIISTSIRWTTVAVTCEFVLISKTSAISPCKATTHRDFPASASIHQERNFERGSKLPSMISTWAITTACTKRCRRGTSVWSACSGNTGSTTTSQMHRHGYGKKSYGSVNALRIWQSTKRFSMRSNSHQKLLRGGASL